jgi:hypothetical protein
VLAVVGRDRPRLVEDRVVKRRPVDVDLVECAAHLGVAFAGESGVIPVPDDSFGVVLGSEVREHRDGIAAGDDEVRPALAVPGTQFRERVEEVPHAGVAGVFEDSVVEDEDRDHGAAFRHGVGAVQA